MRRLKKLYDLPAHQNIKLYYDKLIIIFDHIDGLYSYCWLENDPTKIVHIKNTIPVKKWKDGYLLVIEDGE